MHGLIFVTWEKYLSDRFGSSLLTSYRAKLGETPTTAPHANHVYDDAILLAGVSAACELTGNPADILLREYGHYFIVNGLTSYLCAFLLKQVHHAKDLLLTMNSAHAQLRRTPDTLTPPLFRYLANSSKPNELVLIYDSPRKLCSVLLGAIEGAAERYGEQVRIVERTCMNQGHTACRFEMCFFPSSQAYGNLETAEQLAHQRGKEDLAKLLLRFLPDTDGITLADLQKILQRQRRVHPNYLRPSKLVEALQQLQHVGLVSSTANQLRDLLMERRYWRTPTSDSSDT
ncbi:MAG TPA: heme NO-binding domain-containing protein [Ktedonobacteraceae bacterium]|nr:heme NO-binding domain-containing protein [Ktedonobacteraceae bacterium]